MFNKARLTILSIILLSLPLMGFSCSLFQSGDVKELYQPINLEWWGVWEDSAEVKTLINAYRATHPNVNVTYRKFRFEEYESELTKAWLEQRGPDIFSIPANYLRKYKNLIKPLPKTLKIPSIELSGGANSKPKVVVQNITSLTQKRVKDLFIDIVAEQVIIDEKIYGLPLTVDTLALYYNRDILTKAKIPLPASTWAELVDQTPNLTLFDTSGNIKQAAIALGTHNNIPRNTDILSLLMMQNGTQMTDDGDFATFNTAVNNSDFYPGISALEFYLNFADPNKTVYSWSEDMSDALELFMSGKLAYFIGYNYQAPIIRAGAPKLNFNIAPVLQTVPDVQEVNYADYWAMTTYFGTASQNIAPAWAFIQYATTNTKVLELYLTKTNQPTALRSLINDQIQIEGLNVFADQLLDSSNWYRGYKPEEAEKAMNDLIYQANHNLNSKYTLKNLLDDIVKKINTTIKPE
jgi:multiple sugar transport system substrate-binding protein